MIGVFQPVDFIEDMVKRGWWGEKKGQGFYQRVKTDKGREILTLDYKTMEYRPQQKPQIGFAGSGEQDWRPGREHSRAVRRDGQGGSLCLEASERGALLRGGPAGGNRRRRGHGG